MELSPQDIRDVRFREKLRGYNPEDVDVFVTNVAATVDALRRRIDELERAQQDAPSSEAAPASDVEDQLRRTLVLAQRTADMAVREAQDEASRLIADAEARRQEVLDEAEAMRARMVGDAEAEVEAERNRLHEERAALQRDVDALHAYLAQERERLRIYFADQLRRVEDGVPGVEPAPVPEAAEREPTPAEEPDPRDVGAVGATPAAGAAGADDLDGAGAEMRGAGAGAADLPDGELATGTVFDGDESDDDDPFLAELRRAVTDNEPLGPRDEESDEPRPADKSFDIFDDDDGGGRFLRRRR
ncbi:MAG TPA: DivIVA domain-containing protein [Acidimicrobiales bacterium]